MTVTAPSRLDGPWHRQSLSRQFEKGAGTWDRDGRPRNVLASVRLSAQGAGVQGGGATGAATGLGVPDTRYRRTSVFILMCLPVFLKDSPWPSGSASECHHLTVNCSISASRPVLPNILNPPFSPHWSDQWIFGCAGSVLSRLSVTLW